MKLRAGVNPVPASSSPDRHVSGRTLAQGDQILLKLELISIEMRRALPGASIERFAR
jgi:hypothetical protein